MNERLKELAEQAGFQYIEDERIGWAGNYNASLPKFAELIIRECIAAVEDTTDRYRKDYFADKIKQHFGVE